MKEPTEKKSKSKMVSLIDATRSQNVAIMLTQFNRLPGGYPMIKKGILELDEEMLDVDSVEKMVPNCPEPTDIATVGTKPMHD